MIIEDESFRANNYWRLDNEHVFYGCLDRVCVGWDEELFKYQVYCSKANVVSRPLLINLESLSDGNLFAREVTPQEARSMYEAYKKEQMVFEEWPSDDRRKPSWVDALYNRMEKPKKPIDYN